MKRLILVIISVFIVQFGFAQGQTFKEAKSIEFQEDYREGDKIILLGERTFINIKSWDKNSVEVKAQIISRYKNQNQAKLDLEKIDINFAKSGRKITYSNAIRISNIKDKPLSNLKVELDVFVPHGAILEIENHFGEINIEATLSSLEIESDFTLISITNSKGECEVITKYGDTSINDVESDVKIIADRSNLILKEISGVVELEAKYSEIEVYPSDNTVYKKFKTKFSPVNIYLNSLYSNRIELECDGCVIAADEKRKLMYSLNEKSHHLVLNNKGKVGGTIKSESEDIEIKNY